jgi:hypothetical protein
MSSSLNENARTQVLNRGHSPTSLSPECTFYIWPSLDQNVQTKTDKYGRHEPMTRTVQ